MKLENPHQKFLIDHFSYFDSYAFILELPTATQKSFECISSINNALDYDPYTEYSIYLEHRAFPIILPNFALYNTLEINEYRGTLIATSVHTLRYLFMNDAAKKGLYIYDIMDLNNLSPEFIKKLQEENVKIFVRSPDFINPLQNKIPGTPVVVPDFDLSLIRKAFKDGA